MTKVSQTKSRLDIYLINNMKTERVSDYKVSFVKKESLKDKSFYKATGETCTSIAAAGIAIEILSNQNPGLLVNAVLASTILFGLAIYNLPEYKG